MLLDGKFVDTVMMIMLSAKKHIWTIITTVTILDAMELFIAKHVFNVLFVTPANDDY